METDYLKMDVTLEKLREDLIEHVIKSVVPGHLMDAKTIYYLNPCGNFTGENLEQETLVQIVCV